LLPAILSGMTISKLFLPVSKVLPRHFRRRELRGLNLIQLKRPANSRNPPVVKGLSRRIPPLCLIIILTPTLRISITVRLTVPDMFLSPSLSTQLCSSLDHLGLDPLVIPPRNSLAMLLFSLRPLTTGGCINKQDTTITSHISTRSTNINTPTALVWVKA
jgi:hypothetical protein